jgi:hypothetical protein
VEKPLRKRNSPSFSEPCGGVVGGTTESVNTRGR